MTKKASSAHLSWALAACVFLFNPNVTVFDFLPDFIGYIFLCLAFAKWADLNETVGQALAGFRKMIVVDLCKYLAILWIFGMAVPAERNSSILLWTFVFSVLEVIFAVPAFVKLFDGITEVGYFYPNTSILSTERKRSSQKIKKSRTEKMRSFTVVFLIIKAALCVLPEFADLTNASYDEMSPTVNLYRFIGVMRVGAFIPVLIVGIVWLCRVLRYFGRLRADGTLSDAIAERYESTVCPKIGLFTKRYLRYASVLLGVALVLTLDFRLEGQNLLPDFLAALCFFVSFVFLHKINKERKWHTSAAASVAYFAISLVAAALESKFAERFHLSSLYKNVEAMHLYNLLILANIAKLLLFLALLCLLLSHLRLVIDTHTGFVVGREQIGEQEKKMVASLHGELSKRLAVVMICALVYAATDLCYDFLIYRFVWFGILPTLVGAVTVVFAIRATSAIAEAVETKYMLE